MCSIYFTCPFGELESGEPFKKNDFKCDWTNLLSVTSKVGQSDFLTTSGASW